jgi:hypothetical protein
MKNAAVRGVHDPLDGVVMRSLQIVDEFFIRLTVGHIPWHYSVI